VQVRVTLAVRVAAHLTGRPSTKERDVGAVIGVEPADQVLLGLARLVLT